MRLTNVGRTITLEHTPGMHWFLGGLLIVVGLVGLAATAGTPTVSARAAASETT